MTGLSRRTVVSAAWSAPVIALAVALPNVAASQDDDRIECNVAGGEVESATFEGRTLTIRFHATAQNAVDVTIKMAGHPQIHYNLTRFDRYVDNGQPHERPYLAGGFFTITLPRPYRLATDWIQVRTIHNENCVAVDASAS